MATVELSLPALPIHVRTARLVGVAAARRAGVPDELLDEFRLALGEACSRAVALHAAHAPDVPVRILLRDDATAFTVEVTDVGPSAEPVDADLTHLLDEHAVDPQAVLSILVGLVDDVQITPTEAGTTVCMRWPLVPVLV